MRNPELSARALCLDTTHFAKLARRNRQVSRKAVGKKKFNRRGIRGAKTASSVLAPSIANDLQAVARDRRGEVNKMYQKPVLATKLTETHTAFAQALACTHGLSTSSTSAFVPVSSVDWDNSQLMYGRKGVKLCTAGNACDATRLKHNQGPLHAFLLPGQDPQTGTLCLLCLRLHSELLNAELNAIDPGGVSLALMPPFTNMTNVPGGYFDWSLGVTTANHRVFDRACAIVGSSPHLRVQCSSSENKWWVDQSHIVWKPDASFRQGAQD